jgi:hypothetical protein
MPKPLEQDRSAGAAVQPSRLLIAFMRVLTITCALSILLTCVDGFVNRFDGGGPEAFGWIMLVGGLVLVIVSACSLHQCGRGTDERRGFVVSLVIGVIAIASCVLMPSLNR